MGLELLSRLQTPFQPAAGGSPAHPSPAAEETAHELFEGLPPPPPQLYLPAASKSQHLLPKQSAAKLCPSLSRVHLICCHFVFEEKPLSVLGPGKAGPASANCQPCAVPLVLPWESQVILLHLQSVPYQAAAMGTLWRHRQQTPGSGGPGAALSSALQFCGQAGYHVYLSQQGNYFPHDSSYMLQALPCTEKGLSHLMSPPSVLGTWEGFSWVNTLLAMQGRPHHDPLVIGRKPKLHRYYF